MNISPQSLVHGIQDEFLARKRTTPTVMTSASARPTTSLHLGLVPKIVAPARCCARGSAIYPRRASRRDGARMPCHSCCSISEITADLRVGVKGHRGTYSSVRPLKCVGAVEMT